MGNISGPYWQIENLPVTYSLAPWITGSTTTITYTTNSVQTVTNTLYNTMYTTHTFPMGGNFKVQFKINPAYWTYDGYAGILDNDGVVYVFRDVSQYGVHTLTKAEYGNPPTIMNAVWNTGSTGLYTIAMVNDVCKWYVNNILCWARSASSAPPYRFGVGLAGGSDHTQVTDIMFTDITGSLNTGTVQTGLKSTATDSQGGTLPQTVINFK